jgi:hypothetical protein
VPRRPPRRLLVAGALVVALAATVLLVGQRPPAPPTDLDRTILTVERFVERTRGLRFRRPVRVELLADRAFVARLHAAGDVDVASIKGPTLVALGLIGPGVDLPTALSKLLDAGVVGFYDTETHRLFVRRARLDRFARTVLAHELTHALQDQHFGLTRFDALTGDEGNAATALIEGDAVWVEDRYAAAEAGRDPGAGSSGTRGVPPVALVQLLSFPYRDGPRFVDALRARGGSHAVDAAFRAPPVSTEQIFHPARYFDRDGPAAVRTPSAGGRIEDRGSVGELGLRVMLTGALPSGTVDAAATGWGGDRYVTWRAESHDHFRGRIVMDTIADAAELEATLAEWLRFRTGALTRSGATLTLDVDGPRRPGR